MPPPSKVFDNLLISLRRFRDDLIHGSTDSGACGYKWLVPKVDPSSVTVPLKPRPAPPQLPQTVQRPTRPRSGVPATAPTQVTSAGGIYLSNSKSRVAQEVRPALVPKPLEDDQDEPWMRKIRGRRLWRSKELRREQEHATREQEYIGPVVPLTSPAQPRQTGLVQQQVTATYSKKMVTSYRNSLYVAGAGRSPPESVQASDDGPSPSPSSSQQWAGQGRRRSSSEGDRSFVALPKIKPTLTPLRQAAPRPPPAGWVSASTTPRDPASTITSQTSQPKIASKPRTLEDFVVDASNQLLSGSDKPRLLWCTVDSDSDYRGLESDYFNHFQFNRVLTTKAGLARSLLEYQTASGVCVDGFFPRCYDAASRAEREDFVVDFRRCAALKVVQLHVYLDTQQSGGVGARAYQCNVDLIRAAGLVLKRWCLDLDPEHFDDEGDAEVSSLDEETWDALVLYSELTQAQLCDEEDEGLLKFPRKRFSRPAGGDLELLMDELLASTPRTPRRKTAARPSCVREWPEFQSHTWGQAAADLRDSMQDLLSQLQGLYPQYTLQGSWVGRNVWVVKPGTNSKGSGVECMNTLPELLHSCDRMPNRIVQKYIERPLLLFSGRKFDIRQWVLVRSVTPLKVFIFSECYLRLCNNMYDLGDLRDRERHISNWQVNRFGRNVVEGAAASLAEFRSELRELRGTDDFWETALLPQLKTIVVEVLRAVEDQLKPRAQSFEVFGFDLMVDEDMRMWLLEVNLSPGCEARTPFLENMLSRMSKRLIEVAVLGQEEPDGLEPDWVKICDDLEEGASTRRAVAELHRRSKSDRQTAPNLTVQGQGLKLPKRLKALEAVPVQTVRSTPAVRPQGPMGPRHVRVSSEPEVETLPAALTSPLCGHASGSDVEVKEDLERTLLPHFETADEKCDPASGTLRPPAEEGNSDVEPFEESCPKSEVPASESGTFEETSPLDNEEQRKSHSYDGFEEDQAEEALESPHHGPTEDQDEDGFEEDFEEP